MGDKIVASIRLTEDEVEINCHIIPMVEPEAQVQTPIWAQPVTNAICGWKMAIQQSQPMTVSKLNLDYPTVREKDFCSSQSTRWWSDEYSRPASMQEVTRSAGESLRWRGGTGWGTWVGVCAQPREQP
jgi:hypothetical protein